MNIHKIVSLQEFKKVAYESAIEIQRLFPNLYFGHAGLIPAVDENFLKYDCSPTNTNIFAMTGGDGVQYSILEISKEIQPVVMTVPMNFGHSMKDYNKVLAENLNEFLSIGYFNGWFPLEQLYYQNDWAIDFYSQEDQEQEYQEGAEIQFVKKLRYFFGYNHIPLKNRRLLELENNYFDMLQFKDYFKIISEIH